MKRIKILTIILLLITTFNISAKELDIYSKNAILYNLKEDKVIYEKNSTDKVSIASLTKITTAIVTLEKIKDLDEKITLTNEDFKVLYEANAAIACFGVREEVTYRDLLYGLMLPSGADAAQALTRNEVKNYILNSKNSRKNLLKELDRQVTSRSNNLPDGSTQRIVLDVQGRNYNKKLLREVISNIKKTCEHSYHNIPVDVMS